MTRSLLPHSRDSQSEAPKDRKPDTIININLEPFNICVKLIEPNPIKTEFYNRSADIANRPGLTA